MPRRLALPLLVILAAGLLAAPLPVRAADGWHLKLTQTENGQDQPVEVRLQGDRIRMGIVGAPEEAIVDSQAITVLNHADRTYTVITYAQIEATLGMMADVVKNMQESQRQALKDAMKNLPPDQRERLERQIDGLSGRDQGPTVALEATGESATIAGLEASRLVGKLDGKPVVEVWTTPAIPVAPFLQVLDRLSDIAPQDTGIETRYLQALKGVQGFPLKVVELDKDAGATRIVTTEASNEDFPPGTFDPPAGYAKTAFDLKSLSR